MNLQEKRGHSVYIRFVYLYRKKCDKIYAWMQKKIHEVFIIFPGLPVSKTQTVHWQWVVEQ